MPKSHRNNDLLLSVCNDKQTTGRTVRYRKCPFCGEVIRSLGFVVTKVARGFLLWCHRCHGKAFIKSDKPGVRLALALAQDILKPKDHTNVLTKTRDISLPHDFQRSIPTAGTLWLRTYGITNDEIDRFGIGYSPSLDRVILPVYKDGQLVFWQGRDISGAPDRPKYLSVATQRGSHMFRVNPSTESKTVVIVEDILSAIVVARADFSTAALLGSYASSAVLRQLVDSGYRRVVVWLDPDKRKESVGIAKKLQAMGARSWPVILAGRDPKFYSAEQVRNFVNRGRP